MKVSWDSLRWTHYGASVGTGHGQTATITGTAEHRYWDATTQRWTPADQLRVGDHLQTSNGGTVLITALRGYIATMVTYNLTINQLHTYYVEAGTVPVLVHNSGPGCVDGVGNFISGSAEGQKLAEQLRLASAASPFGGDGSLTSAAIGDSSLVIPGAKIGNPAVQDFFAANGGPGSGENIRPRRIKAHMATFRFISTTIRRQETSRTITTTRS
jgi:hypothetical protein